MIKERIREIFKDCIDSLIDKKQLSVAAQKAGKNIVISRAKEPKYGDYAVNIAMVLAKPEKKSPRDIALLLKENLDQEHKFFDKIEIAGPGFINLFLSEKLLGQVIPHIAQEGKDFGKSAKRNKKALVEFVSANPTGGLHVGHARGAFVGDGIARLLDAAGFDVTKEFYVNDTGNQVEVLARTVYKRYLELFGRKIEILEGEYPGEYVRDIAQALKERDQDKWLDLDQEEYLEPIMKFAIDYNLAKIKKSLELADISMDQWFFESQLHKDGKLDDLLAEYAKRSMLYQAQEAKNQGEKVRHQKSKAAKFAHLQEGGTFLKTAQFGDDEDRIVRRKDGRFVYLTADLAYHHEKFLRGYDLMIDVFGADHRGHINRIKAGMKALGHDQNKLKFATVQMVRLLRMGIEVKFSKRMGEVLALDYLIDEVGKDVARFVFLMRSANSHFDLDLDAVTKKSHENPVYYVQYGHARMATILKKAQKDFNIKFDAAKFDLAQQEKLQLQEERDMLLKVSELKEVLCQAAEAHEPHRLINFCHELIKSFHSYFTKYRHSEKIISEDQEKTTARLCLVFAMKQAIFNALSILGLSAPDHMELDQDLDASA